MKRDGGWVEVLRIKDKCKGTSTGEMDKRNKVNDI